jgi:plastocyanin
MRAWLPILLLAITLVPASVACSGDDDDEADVDSGESSPTPTATATEPEEVGGGSLEITMEDAGHGGTFEPNQLTVEAGASVIFNLTNDGEATHNMRIAGADDRYNTADDAVSDPESFSGGVTGTLAWTAPNEPGSFNFQCDFHPMAMTGDITVE